MDVTRTAVERRLELFRRRCAEARLAMTPQRLAIYRLLASDAGHPSAEDLFARIKPDMPSLSRGTVYRTLDLLHRHGLVHRVSAGGDTLRFDANLDEHHHLICVRCHAVRDLELDELPMPFEPPAQLHGFRVLGQHLHVMGICPGCRSRR
jgi:Fur family peroxide stress response transcriptional regulator